MIKILGIGYVATDSPPQQKRYEKIFRFTSNFSYLIVSYTCGYLYL